MPAKPNSPAPYADASAWVAYFHPAHAAHVATLNAMDASAPAWLAPAFLRLEVAHALRRLASPHPRAAALEAMAAAPGALWLHCPELDAALPAAVLQAENWSRQFARPGDLAGAADLIHLFLCQMAGTRLHTRDRAQADFARRLRMPVTFHGLEAKTPTV